MPHNPRSTLYVSVVPDKSVTFGGKVTVHDHPVSTEQLVLHPSPFTPFPSSHASPASKPSEPQPASTLSINSSSSHTRCTAIPLHDVALPIYIHTLRSFVGRLLWEGFTGRGHGAVCQNKYVHNTLPLSKVIVYARSLAGAGVRGW